MKKLSIYSLVFITTIILSGCGSSDTSSSTTNTIGAGETVTLSAGTTISTYSGTCSPNIVVNLDGTWAVTNASTGSNDICQYN